MKKKESLKKTSSLTYVDIISGAPIPDKSFYLLTGSDMFAFTQMEHIFKKRYMSDDPSGYNTARFNCDHNTKANSIVNVSEEYPFGSQYKLLIVDNARKMSGEEGEKLAGYLKNPCPTTKMVIIAQEEDKVSEKKFNPLKSLKEQLKTLGLHIPCQLSPYQVKDWIRERFEREGKKIDGQAVEMMVEYVGTNLWDLSQEIDKLVIYRADKDSIRSEHIKKLTSHNPQSKIFNLTEFVGLKRIGKALMTLDELLKEKIFGSQVIVSLNNHFSLLYSVRKLMDEGYDADGISKKLHKHPFYIKKTMKQAGNFADEALETAFDLLARADGGLKSGIDPRWVMELTLIQLCRL